MSVAKANIRYNYRDYLLLPEGKRYEIIDGDMHMMTPSPNASHQKTLMNLHILLHHYNEKHREGEIYIAPFDVVLSDEDIVQPDLLFVSKKRKEIITEKNIQGAPDLVVEILSPATAKLDRLVKMKTYAKHGVHEYWLVDPKRKSVEVCRWSKKGFELLGLYSVRETLKSDVFKNLHLKVKEIFA